MQNSTRPKSTGKAKKSTAKKFSMSVHKASQMWVKTYKGKRQYYGAVADDPTGEKVKPVTQLPTML